jgi:PiT family inorganic phosphate transporter
MDDMPVDKSWSESLKDLFQAIVTPKKLPMLAATGFLNFGHSLNDAQKAMPIVAWSLSSDPTAITQNVQMLCYGAMTLGTLSGGRRIVDKLVHGVSSKHDPRVGLVAAAVSSLALTFANISHAPVSTSQTMGAATIGANAGLHHQHMNWKTATDMATAWAVTPVATGAIAAGLYELSKIIPHAPK